MRRRRTRAARAAPACALALAFAFGGAGALAAPGRAERTAEPGALAPHGEGGLRSALAHPGPPPRDEPRAPPAGAAHRARSGRSPDVVVVVVDTLRADRLQAAVERGAVPWLAARFASGVSFVDALSVSSWTPTAVASLFTSRHPLEHQLRTGLLAVHPGEPAGQPAPAHRLPARLPTLAAVLRAAGYATFGISDNVNVGPALGLDRGFDHFEVSMDGGAAALAERALALAPRLAAARPSFLYLHFMDPHAPYRARPDSGAARASPLARYDFEIVRVDRALARIAAALRWGDDTLLVFTADHGEEFGEHGGSGHANKLYDELLRVPLLFHRPARLRPAVRREPASVLDLLPTLRGVLGLAADAGDRGVDLLSPAATERAAARTRYARRWSESVSPAIEKSAVIDGSLKLVRTAPSGRLELYDRDSDPGERRDLARLRPTERHRLLRMLHEHTERNAGARPEPAGDGQVDPELEQRLRALGYVR